MVPREASHKEMPEDKRNSRITDRWTVVFMCKYVQVCAGVFGSWVLAHIYRVKLEDTQGRSHASDVSECTNEAVGEELCEVWTAACFSGCWGSLPGVHCAYQGE